MLFEERGMSLNMQGARQTADSGLSEQELALGSPEARVQARIDLLRTHIIEPYLRDLELLGQFDKRDDKQNSALLSLQSLEAALRRYESGENFGQIAAAIGVPPSRVKSWLVDGRLPNAISGIGSDSRKAKSFEVRIPHEESTSFAYLLGVSR